MDLNRLRIDRDRAGPGRATVRASRPGAWSRLVSRLILLAALAALAYFFRAPLLRAVDRLRLEAVEVARVTAPDPIAAGAVRGTAANGYVVARVRAALSADTPGRIVELNVVEGQAVEKGFVVARLFAEEYEAALRRSAADLDVARASAGRARAEVEAAGADTERLESSRRAAEAGEHEAIADLNLARIERDRARQLVAQEVESQAVLDEAEARLAAAEARVATARAQKEAATAAVGQGRSRLRVAEAAEREALAEVTVREALRDQAQATLDKTNIRAPFDGIVVLKDAEVGEVVSPNSQAGGSARGSVATMVDFSSLEVQAEVPETALAGVAVGAPAQIFLDAFPERPYQGEVDRIWPTADRQQATIEVRIRFLERDAKLRPEMGVRVVFGAGDGADAATLGADPPAGSGAELLLIPAAALVRAGGQSGVFILERDVVRFRAVVTSGAKGDRILVGEGLVAGELVVVSPPPALKDGDRVRPSATQ